VDPFSGASVWHPISLLLLSIQRGSQIERLFWTSPCLLQCGEKVCGNYS
jgi:hypothetical protein